MTPARFRLLAAFTLISVTAAGWTLATRPAVISAATDQGLVFPELAAHTNEIAAIKIEDSTGTVTLRHKGNDWVFVEQSGYPADIDKVANFIGAIASLRLVEPKTARPDALARLQLEEPGPKAKSKRVTLLDKDGKQIAALIVGKSSYTLGTRGQAGLYLRLDGQNQSWLVMGKVDTPNPPIDWMKRNLIDLQDRLIQTITFQQGSENLFTIQRKPEGPLGFTVTPTPAGPVDDNKVNQKGAIFSGLMFEKAAPSAGVTLPRDAMTITAKSDTGITATLIKFQYEGADWVEFKFALDKEQLKAWAAAYKPDPMRKDPERDKDPTGAMQKAYDDAVKATTGWIFKLPDYKRDQINAKSVDDFLKGS